MCSALPGYLICKTQMPLESHESQLSNDIWVCWLIPWHCLAICQILQRLHCNSFAHSIYFTENPVFLIVTWLEKSEYIMAQCLLFIDIIHNKIDLIFSHILCEIYIFVLKWMQCSILPFLPGVLWLMDLKKFLK